MLKFQTMGERSPFSPPRNSQYIEEANDQSRCFILRFT